MGFPIRIRLAAVYCSIFCVSTAALETASFFALRSAIDAIVDHDLKARLDGVEEFLDEHVSRKTLSQVQAELATHAALQPDHLVIVDSRGNRIFPAGNEPRISGRDAEIPTSGPRMPLRILAARRRVHGEEFALYLATDLSVPFDILKRFRWMLILSAPIALIVATAAGYWVSKSALRPLSELAANARPITTANLNRRVPVSDSGDEVESLARTINEMLGRIEDGFRRMTHFTANASHELRTPIALMRTTSEVALLAGNATAETYREALHRILSEAEKSTDLLNDMLQLARADCEPAALRLEPLELVSAIAQVAESIAPLAAERDLNFTFAGLDRAVWVAAEPGHLRRLWLVLLDNAFRYTPSGGTVRIRCRMASAGQVACEIEDSGIGIAEPDFPRIFERFYRADRARNRHENGAGLGLTIAKWIVDAHNGTIEVVSRVGHGSIFRVALPILPLPARDAVNSESFSASLQQNLQA